MYFCIRYKDFAGAYIKARVPPAKTPNLGERFAGDTLNISV